MSRLAVTVLALALAGLAGAADGRVVERPVVVHGCDGLYYEPPGRPQLLVVSDLPLEDSAHTAMRQMTQAVKLTLKDRGFRAGRFRVGYVVCDDSGPAGTWSARRCTGNARAAARNADVVGVIGTLDSGCARVELPVLGHAKILLVSPLNTAVDLTRGHRGQIARLSARDDLQAAAAARFLRRLGVRTVAALADDTARGKAYRSQFVDAARGSGLRVVAHGRADGAYVGGILGGRPRATLLAARARAPGGPIALAAGYGPAAQLAAVAGGAAEGAYLFVAGVPDERLGAPGRSFVRHFDSAIGTSPHPFAVYAAQAARLLLDAIARSRGTRQSIGRAVLSTHESDGLIGRVSFDANGDLRRPAVTIFRIHERSAKIVQVVRSGLP